MKLRNPHIPSKPNEEVLCSLSSLSQLIVTSCKHILLHSYSATRCTVVDSTSLLNTDTNFQSFSQIQTKKNRTVHVFCIYGMEILVPGHDYIKHYELTSLYTVFCVTHLTQLFARKNNQASFLFPGEKSA